MEDLETARRLLRRVVNNECSPAEAWVATQLAADHLDKVAAALAAAPREATPEEKARVAVARAADRIRQYTRAPAAGGAGEGGTCELGPDGVPRRGRVADTDHQASR